MQNKIGPGQYEPNVKIGWKKKTFNILFAEI